MVYYLGGGTLDITILEIDGDNIDILLSEGARHLGGANFDELLLEMLAEEYRKKNNAELFLDERQRRRRPARSWRGCQKDALQIAEDHGNDRE